MLYSCALQALPAPQPIVYCRLHACVHTIYCGIHVRFRPCIRAPAATMLSANFFAGRTEVWSKSSYHWVPTLATASPICARPSPLCAISPTITALSDAYETEPVGFTAQPWFVNAVVALQMEHRDESVSKEDAPAAPAAALLAIERALGRERDSADFIPKGPRVIDLDIVLYGSRVDRFSGAYHSSPGHASAPLRAGAVAQIAPGVEHPVLRRSVLQLLQALPPDGRWCAAGACMPEENARAYKFAWRNRMASAPRMSYRNASPRVCDSH